MVVSPFLCAEEIAVKKGIILCNPMVESRARSASEKVNLSGTVKKYSSTFYTNRILLRVATELFERIEIFGDIGSADISAPDFDDYSSPLTLIYGGGMDFKMIRSSAGGHPYAFLGIRYLQYEPVKDTINIELDHTLTAATSRISWKEWEVNMGAGFRSGSLGIEGGVRFSFIDAHEQLSAPDFLETLHLKEDDNAGMFINADIFIDPEEKFAFNIGVTAIDVNSIIAGVKLWF